jgi:hypothetical protein
MKNAVFWDVTFLCSMRQMLVTANVVPSLPILVSRIKEQHGVTSQKTAFFIATAVKTSNLAK